MSKKYVAILYNLDTTEIIIEKDTEYTSESQAYKAVQKKYINTPYRFYGLIPKPTKRLIKLMGEQENGKQIHS